MLTDLDVCRHGSPAAKLPAEAPDQPPPAGDVGGEEEGAPERLIRSLMGW